MNQFLLTVLGSLSIATTAAAATISATRPDSDSLWFHSVAHAETSLGLVPRRVGLEPTERDAILAQIRQGTEHVRFSVLAAVSADSLRTGRLTDPPPAWQPPSPWGNRFLRFTSISSVALGLTNIVATFYEVDPRTRSTIGLTGGTIGSVGALYSLLRPRPKPPPPVDPNERIRTLSREMLIADTFTESGRALREAAAELDVIRTTTPASDEEAVALARRYAAVLAITSALLDVQIPHAASVARQSSGYPAFSASARGRLAALADHLDQVSSSWRARRWLVARSERVTLDWLSARDRP